MGKSRQTGVLQWRRNMLSERGLMMKATRNILLIATTMCAYAICVMEGMFFYAVFFIPGEDIFTVYGSGSAAGYLYCGLTAAIVVMALVAGSLTGLYYRRSQKPEQQGLPLGRTPFVFKLALIPFFCFQALSVVLFTVGGYAGSFVALFVPVMPLIPGIVMGTVVTIILTVKIVVNYLMVVMTSVYAMADLLTACKRLGTPTGLRVLFAVLQFIPVADIISLPNIMSHLDFQARRLFQTNIFDKPPQ